MVRIICRVATGIFTVLFLPFIVANIQKLLEAKHWDEFLLNWWPAMPDLRYLIESRWFLAALCFSGGVATALWVVRLWAENGRKQPGQVPDKRYKDSIFIPIKNVIEQIYTECEADVSYTELIISNKAIYKSRDDMLNWIADYYFMFIDTPIYGQDSYSTELKEIPKAKFSSGHFGEELTSLYANVTNEKQYSHLSIKQSEMRQAIAETKKIMFNLSG